MIFLLLSLVVNLELMDVVKEKKYKDNSKEGQESNGIPKWNELLGGTSSHWGTQVISQSHPGASDFRDSRLG